MTLKVIVVNASSTLTNTTIWFVAALCFIVDVRTYVRLGGTFLPGLLGHLSDDLKIIVVTVELCCIEMDLNFGRTST